jgi:hypothetical protein
MERPEHRFIVRIWYEGASGSEGQWRGAVDHVGHERRLYFSSLGDLMDFIRARMAARDAGQPPAAERQDPVLD